MHAATLESARRLERHKCSQDKAQSAAECIKNEIGKNNESHFFVATQDKELQKYLSKVRIYACASAQNLSLSPPTAANVHEHANAL